MSEMYRPLGRMEKERFKRLNEPRAWEYQVLSQEELAWNRSRLERNYRQEQPVVNITAGGILLLAFL
jgi:hypothetical protein